MVTSAAARFGIEGTSRTAWWTPRPGRWLLIAGLAAIVVYAASTMLRLAIPAPTGPHAVGRETLVWVDYSRPEHHTIDPGDVRSVPIQVWYPAQPGTGRPAEYVDNLDAIEDGLKASGELSWVEVLGLRMVRHQAFEGAEVAATQEGFPLLVLSPGNATNVAFYAALAEDLASRGYVVIGVDHPFQVAATVDADGSVAWYDRSMETSLRSVEPKIEERVEDIAFLLGQLRAGAAGTEFLESSLDLDRIGILGHSNGGLTAVEMCRRDPALGACLNIDGQAAGGPFGHEVDALAPEQPFMYLTKESAIHEELHRRFEAAGDGAVRAVVPNAAHGDFADGGMFEPDFIPFSSTAESVVMTTRALAAAFFDHWLKEPRQRPFAGLDVGSDVFINIYPLGDRQPIPTELAASVLQSVTDT